MEIAALAVVPGGSPMVIPARSVSYSNALPFHTKTKGQLEPELRGGFFAVVVELAPPDVAVDVPPSVQAGVPGSGQSHLPSVHAQLEATVDWVPSQAVSVTSRTHCRSSPLQVAPFTIRP
jgi:hypothetical protein